MTLIDLQGRNLYVGDQPVSKVYKGSRMIHGTIEYVMGTDADFTGNGPNFKYVGSAEYIEIPDKIRNYSLTSYYGLFQGTNIKGVKSTNTRITRMDNMFRDTTAETIDVSQLDTSSVTLTSSMFQGSQAEEIIGIENLNLSNVGTLTNMFRDSKVKKLDLSLWDLKEVTSVASIFRGSIVEHIDISTWVTPKIINGAELFSDSTIKAVDFGDWDIARVGTTNSRNFNANSELTTVYAMHPTTASIIRTNSISGTTVTESPPPEGFYDWKNN